MVISIADIVTWPCSRKEDGLYQIPDLGTLKILASMFVNFVKIYENSIAL